MKTNKMVMLTFITDKQLRKKVVEYAKRFGVKPENDIYKFIQKIKRKTHV